MKKAITLSLLTLTINALAQTNTPPGGGVVPEPSTYAVGGGLAVILGVFVWRRFFRK